ncbi:PREDICTED: WAT1-related protein At5g40210 isoform X3 [Camelina sativa]|uniref:WAT1-related protein n=1 Tax=Camelina sativa TaxID=90675 RepID=A0ABM1QQ53_CAMSA|nr:PREDICTED: WAT1-related protein At5g40210 isoform X3 [Camelina sativa]
MAPGRLGNRDGWILTAMVATEFSNVGVNTLVKAATSKGLSPFVVLVYSYTFGSLLLLPLTFLSFRTRSLPPLTFSILCNMGILGLIALQWDQIQLTDFIFGHEQCQSCFYLHPRRYFPAHTMSRYPSAVVVTLVHNVFVAVVCAFVSLLAEKDDPKAWIIRFDITLISVVATGTLNSGYYVIHSWAVSHKGPVYLSMFKPVSILIAAASTFIFLGESLYLGSVIGGIFISIGFYMVLWGKTKDDKVDILGIIESSSPSHKAPLLVY